MTVFQAPVRFFAGASTPCGYKNSLPDLYRPEDGWRVYLIKSGPGTGKSTLMKRVYEELSAGGEEAEVFCCSADPSSLDGVRFPRLRVCLLDATEPHVVEPRYWGVCEQLVPLSVCMNEEALYARRRAYLTVAEENRALHARCRRLLSGAASLLNENARLQRDTIDEEKISRTAARLASREFPAAGGEGNEQRRFLSAVTPEGVLPLFETVQALCPRIYALADDYGAASSLLLTELRKRALAAGLDILTCPCPLSPENRLEHLLIPSLGLAFVTSNRAHTVDFPVLSRLHAARFSDAEALRRCRQRLSFNHRAAEELLNGAVVALSEAREVHDRMEAICGAAMNWERAREMQDALVEKILKLAT